MALSGWTADRLGAILVYLVASGLALWAGTKLINHSIETKFYKDYLIKWELNVETFLEKGGKWPEFTGNNHVSYMDEVVKRMNSLNIEPPKSNTSRPYTYRLDLLGGELEKIFVLTFPERLVIFGMSPKTFSKVDRYIDGVVDTESGKFTGREDTKTATITAQWRVQ